MLGGAAAEVEQQPLAVDASRAGAARDRRRAPRARPRRAARRRAAPPGTRACAARSSRAPRRSPRAGARRRGARRARASRSAPVRLAASCARRSARRSCRLAHARDELLDRRARSSGRGRDHDALLRQRAAVGRHRAGHAPADVGVVRAAGREADQRVGVRVREHGRDDGDVGQVGAARERVVEDPRDARSVVARRAPPPPPRASRRGARGCARPA